MPVIIRVAINTIVALLGSGGMGEVYRARDTRLNRQVAIKFLSDGIADPLTISRFQQEALTASSLNHPHILTVFESGEIDGKQYLVAELVDGRVSPEYFWLLDLPSKKARQLSSVNSRSTRTFDITPDGAQITFDRLKDNSDIVLIDLPQP